MTLMFTQGHRVTGKVVLVQSFCCKVCMKQLKCSWMGGYVLKEMPETSCDLCQIPAPVLHGCLEEISPIVKDIINKSLSSGFVLRCFKTCSCQTSADKKLILIRTAWKLSSCFQSAIFFKSAGAYCVETVFFSTCSLTAFWSPSSQLTESALAPKPPCCVL